MSLPPVEIPLGAMRFNSDSQKLEYFNGDIWMHVHTFTDHLAQSGEVSGTRGIWSGGAEWPSPSPYNSNKIDAVSLASQGNAFDFGDNTEARRNSGQCASSTRALLAGGYTSARVNTIDFITISSTGNAADFGDRTTIGQACAGVSNRTRGIWAGANTPSATNIIDYITIASTGNAADFGDCTHTNNNEGSFGSPTRGIIGPNGPDGAVSYITIATTGNAAEFVDFNRGRTEVPASGSTATRGIFAAGERQPGGAYSSTISIHTITTLGAFQDFGDCTSGRAGMGGASSSTRLLMAGGSNPSTPSGYNSIEYVTFATTGDAVDFGDLTAVRNPYSGCSNGHGGLG